MLDLRGGGVRALQQDNIESAQPIFDVVAGQILSRQLDQLLLLPLMDGMDGPAEHVAPTRLHLDKDEYLPVLSH